jgi:uncharacterized protein YbjT (DUF2867 family)
MVRDERRFDIECQGDRLSVVRGDLLNEASLQDLPLDIDAAYYLVHSMSSASKDYPEMEAKAAQNFVAYIDRTRAKQIIYLSGIANEQRLSRHLSSRRNVEKILGTGRAPVTVLRAAIIIGSGSASFEIIRDLVEKLPFMITPKWVHTKCQPIGIRDVVFYLIAVMDKPDSYNQIFDIGGPDILTYKEMMLEYADVRGLPRLVIDVPVFSPKLSSYWLYFITTTSYSLAKNLVDSMKCEVVREVGNIDEVVPHQPMSYRKSLELALMRIQNDEVLSSWKDSMVTSRLDHRQLEFVHVPTNGVYTNVREKRLAQPVSKITKRIWSIGGKTGWYSANWAWQLRGILDKMVGGPGLRRGRRSPTDLRVGDSVDFWRVLLVDKEGPRLVFFAEMRLPGEAWLEFEIFHKGRNAYYRQTATFRPRGVLGRLYWWSLEPIHPFIFEQMARSICLERSTKTEYPSRLKGRTYQGKPRKRRKKDCERLPDLKHAQQTTN